MVSIHYRKFRVLGIALLLSVLFLGVITPAYAQTYGFILKWGSEGSGDGQFSYSRGVAVDGSGNVYVADQSNHRVQKFTGSGAFILKWGSYGFGDGQLNSPRGVAVDGSGNVYVAENSNHRVQKFTGSGAFITKWGSQGSGDGQFSWPEGVAVDGSGNVYVADTSNSRVQKFTSSGVFITKWGSQGWEDGQFWNPFGVAVDSSGNVYVADTYNHRVQKFGLGYTLTITTTAGGYTSPSPGTHAYGVGIVVSVSAGPYSDCYFDHWVLDGNTRWENPISVTMNQDHSLHAVFVTGLYSVIVMAHCNTEGVDVSVSITMDGSPTGFSTPHTFTGLTGSHTFTVPSTDASGHSFSQWSTGSTSTTITVTGISGTLYCIAYFNYYGGEVPEFPGANISIVAVTFAFIAAFYLTLKRKKQTTKQQM